MIYLSAGHHNKDSGAFQNGYKEADLTKELRNLMVDVFEKRKHTIIIDRDFETNSQYQGRIKPGTGSVIVDLHFNSSGNKTATGVEVIVNNNANKDSISLAKEICESLSKIMQIQNRGVKKESDTARGGIGILRLKAGISVLVEVCFMSNINDLQAYLNNKEAIACTLVDLAIKYDDLK